MDGCLARDFTGLDVRTNDGWDSSLFCTLSSITEQTSVFGAHPCRVQRLCIHPVLVALMPCREGSFAW